MKIMVAHSPDADDIFMYYAIRLGWVGLDGIEFDNVALDIETLNAGALKNEYEVCAISFALYPKIRDEYALLSTAMSFGEGYGPKLVKMRDKKLKRNFKVALSGANTTNAMLFRIAYPETRITYMNFLEIEQAVLDGVVDAGVLIHEAILTYSDALEVEREIWDIWVTLAGDGLPLPLGGMAIRRSMPLVRAIRCEETLTKAVRVAERNKSLLSKMLQERGLIRVDDAKLEKYLSLYANERSVVLDDLAKKAIDKLFEIGYKAGFYDELARCDDYLLPAEYNKLRYS
jgi:1,4-dihydroxy-6-naphthoate synthase